MTGAWCWASLVRGHGRRVGVGPFTDRKKALEAGADRQDGNHEATMSSTGVGRPGPAWRTCLSLLSPGFDQRPTPLPRFPSSNTKLDFAVARVLFWLHTWHADPPSPSAHTTGPPAPFAFPAQAGHAGHWAGGIHGRGGGKGGGAGGGGGCGGGSGGPTAHVTRRKAPPGLFGVQGPGTPPTHASEPQPSLLSPTL